MIESIAHELYHIKYLNIQYLLSWIYMLFLCSRWAHHNIYIYIVCGFEWKWLLCNCVRLPYPRSIWPHTTCARLVCPMWFVWRNSVPVCGAIMTALMCPICSMALWLAMCYHFSSERTPCSQLSAHPMVILRGHPFFFFIRPKMVHQSENVEKRNEER